MLRLVFRAALVAVPLTMMSSVVFSAQDAIQDPPAPPALVPQPGDAPAPQPQAADDSPAPVAASVADSGDAGCANGGAGCANGGAGCARGGCHHGGNYVAFGGGVHSGAVATGAYPYAVPPGQQMPLFYNYYVGPPGVPAQLYPGPRPTPPFVGQVWITYPPFMPHEYLYHHHRTYYKHTPGGYSSATVKYNNRPWWLTLP